MQLLSKWVWPRLQSHNLRNQTSTGIVEVCKDTSVVLTFERVPLLTSVVHWLLNMCMPACTCSGSSLKNKQMFNIICELPETVARSLVPRMRVVKGSGKAVNYLTPPRILLALVTAWLRRGRWFDDQVFLITNYPFNNPDSWQNLACLSVLVVS